MIRYLAFISLLFTTPGLAQDLATGSAIRSAISGNTVQGSMVQSGVYTEFYAKDGTIKGNGYSGEWKIEQDTMCFTYDAEQTCLEARVDGDQITWVNNNEDDGTGTIVPGNPNGF